MIAEGDRSPSGEDWQFSLAQPGCTVYVYCSISNSLLPVVVTGYALVDDVATAVKDGGFPRRAVACERFRNLVTDDAPWSDAFRDFEIGTEGDRPVHVKGHPLSTRAGWSTAYCHACESHYASLSTLRETDCES